MDEFASRSPTRCVKGCRLHLHTVTVVPLQFMLWVASVSVVGNLDHGGVCQCRWFCEVREARIQRAMSLLFGCFCWPRREWTVCGRRGCKLHGRRSVVFIGSVAAKSSCIVARWGKEASDGSARRLCRCVSPGNTQAAEHLCVGARHFVLHDGVAHLRDWR